MPKHWGETWHIGRIYGEALHLCSHGRQNNCCISLQQMCPPDCCIACWQLHQHFFIKSHRSHCGESITTILLRSCPHWWDVLPLYDSSFGECEGNTSWIPEYYITKCCALCIVSVCSFTTPIIWRLAYLPNPSIIWQCLASMLSNWPKVSGW